jgi:hypothetical protein
VDPEKKIVKKMYEETEQSLHNKPEDSTQQQQECVWNTGSP